MESTQIKSISSAKVECQNFFITMLILGAAGYIVYKTAFYHINNCEKNYFNESAENTKKYIRDLRNGTARPLIVRKGENFKRTIKDPNTKEEKALYSYLYEHIDNISCFLKNNSL